MIERYLRPEMKAIWSEARKLSIWFEVEIAAVEGWAECGVVPTDAAERIRSKAKLDIERVKEIEEVTRHDIAAFVQSLEESVGKEDGRWIHMGLTSSDVLDTTFALQLREATGLLIDAMDALGEAIKRRAYEHKYTPMVGRSHGIHAEPTTFGHTLAIWYDEVQRGIARLERARDTISFGKISGPVGTYSNVTPEVESYVCAKFGLTPCPASNQVIQRDRHAEYFVALGLVASSLEKFAVQIRHLQRTEVGEAEERFHKGQKGSSAMPHKRNPVLTENVTGLARLVRGYVMPALENVALWHERDISHSSVERVAAPDASTLLHFAIHRMTKVIDELVVYPENMKRNLEQTRGLVFSQGVLVRLIQAGWSRDDAYAAVQKVAMECWESGGEFESAVRSDDTIVASLSASVLDDCFDEERGVKFVDAVFERVFT